MTRRLVAATLLALATCWTVVGSSAASTIGTGARTATTCLSVAFTPDRVWDVASTRLAALAAPATTFPFGTTGDGAYLRTSAYSWTSGFYPASLWLMYGKTRDPRWLARARSFTDRLLPVATWTGTHDLGFMIGVPMRLGAALDPSGNRQQRYREAIISAADSLAKRWNRQVGAVKSGDYGGKWGLIIDSAMNAPLLIEAARSVDSKHGKSLERKGLQHMKTLAANLVRSDGSTIHRMAFNAKTGQPLGPLFGQGLSEASTWARGQAWAIHGFTDAYTFTHDPGMLDAALNTANYWIEQVPAGCVPAWDLDVDSPTAPRDTSAAAIAADALVNLGKADPDPDRGAQYSAYGSATRAALTAPRWVPDGAGRGVLRGQSYNIPAVAREGSYVWGDFYLLESLAETG